MGAGKTSAGRELARLLRLPFKDTDEEVRRASGLPSHEFILKRGLGAFRKAEDTALRRLARGPAAVISLGGGIYPSRRRAGLFRKSGVSVWLRRPLTEMLRLAGNEGRRPLLARKSADAVGRLFDRREKFYAKCDLRVNAAGLKPAAAARAIRRQLENNGFIAP